MTNEETTKTLSDYISGVDYRLECALKVPCRSFYEKLSMAVNRALSALRENQEREKGCEYCADREDLAFGHDSMKRVGSIYIDGNLLVADLYSESMAVAVCFCPMCGKALREVKRDE